MNIAPVFIAYFGIKETQFHPDTGAWRGQYMMSSVSSLVQCWGADMQDTIPSILFWASKGE